VRKFGRGISGFEGLVWCSTLQMSDVVLHVHNPWWSPYWKPLIWAHEDREETTSQAIYLVPDLESLEQLGSAQNWLEAAALLRALPANHEAPEK
jgi:hypothetical protein